MGRVKARLLLQLPGRPHKSLECVGPLCLSAHWFSLASISFVCPTAPLSVRLCALVFDLCLLWTYRISLCHVTGVSLFGAVLSCVVLLVAVQKVLTALH